MNDDRWPAAMLIAAVLALSAGQAPAAGTSGAPETAAVPTLDWKTLLPEAERRNPPPRMPPAAHDYLSEGDVVALQTGSFEPNRELEGRRVRIPGFVVPLARSDDGLIGEFLLVPYFGACIHLPPPPPNQVVHVKMRPGAGVKSIDDAMWVTGTLRVSLQKSSMGSAVYTLDGEHMRAYDPAER